MSEHRVRVDSGKYEFVQRAGHVEILRDGSPWGRTDYPKAIGSLMAELDAARVVLKKVRELSASWRAGAQTMLEEALRTHDSLVDDREPPSPWATIRGEDPDEIHR